MSRRELVAKYDAGASLESFSPAERAELRQAIVAEPAYHDRHHKDHALLVADAGRLYAMDVVPAEDDE